jgi:hypothetical protein
MVSIENSVLQLSTPQGTSTTDETCMKFLSETLVNCLSQHKLCSLGHDNWIPTRLLDVHKDSNEHDYIKVVERNDAQTTVANIRVKYLTLSHVWGCTHPLMLTEANYNDMKMAIAIDLLPQCFLDVVNITRRLGIRYLWIDSLWCASSKQVYFNPLTVISIVQDSAEDWAEEAATMEKVYRNGVCNIAACNGTDSSHSLFVQRNPRAGGPFTVIQKYAEQTVKFTLIPDWVNLTWDTAPLYTRGWAVQERFLSTRVMHFSEFPFWECDTTLTTEVYPSGLEPNILCFPELPETQRKWLSSSKDAESSVWLWWKLVKIYTKCSLTVKTDKLIALGGMAETFSKFINEPYLAGIWGGEHLPLGLLWRVEKGSPRGELGSGEYRGLLTLFSTLQVSTNLRIAPSWSWASRDGMVFLYPFRKILQPLIQVVSIYTVPKSRNLFGQVISGELVLKGFLFEVSVEKGHRKDLRFAGEMHLDHQSVEPSNEKIYFLPIAELLTQNEKLRGMRSFTGIFLQVTKNSRNLGKRIFNRIGDCYIMHNGGDGFVLDIPSWNRLLDLHSPAEFGEELVIV